MQFTRNGKVLVAAAIFFLVKFAFATSNSFSGDQIPKSVDLILIICCAAGVSLMFMAYTEEKKRPK